MQQRRAGGITAQRHVDHPNPGEPRGVNAGGNIRVEELAAVGAPTASRVVGAHADDGRAERDPKRIDAVAGGSGDSTDRGAMPAFVAHPAIADDIAACRIDPACELGQSRIDAAVDNADLDPAAGRSLVIGCDRIGIHCIA